MSVGVIEIVNDLIDLFDKRGFAAVVVYKTRGDDESAISLTATVDELVDLASTVALVAAREMAGQLNIDGDAAAILVRDALAERITLKGTTIATGKVKK